MSRPTLLGRLLAWQLLLTGSSCLLLVAGTMLVGAVLLRRTQDQTLRSLGQTICTGVAAELSERTDLSLAQAVEEFVAEAVLEGYAVEAWDPAGLRLIETGPSAGAPGVSGDGVRCTSWLDARRPRIRFRSCVRSCSNGLTVRIGGPDALATSRARRSALALAGLLPLAVLFGGLAGRAVFLRLLRPVGALRSAAARIEARPRMALGVGVELAELAELERAFDSVLRRLGQALERERRFAQEASHELRTPLTALRLRLESLGSPDLPAAERDARLGQSLADLDALDRLIEALLVLARSESLVVPSVPVNVCDLARQVAGWWNRPEPVATRPIEVEAPDEILIAGSEELLARALSNLVENSRKYAGSAARIRIRAFRSAEQAVLAVDDDGPGVPESLRPFIFERFYRGSGQRQETSGTGLGLAFVDSVARRHGGTAEARPGERGGEEIRMSLPLLAPSSTTVSDPGLSPWLGDNETGS